MEPRLKDGPFLSRSENISVGKLFVTLFATAKVQLFFGIRKKNAKIFSILSEQGCVNLTNDA